MSEETKGLRRNIHKAYKELGMDFGEPNDQTVTGDGLDLIIKHQIFVLTKELDAAKSALARVCRIAASGLRDDTDMSCKASLVAIHGAMSELKENGGF